MNLLSAACKISKMDKSSVIQCVWHLFAESFKHDNLEKMSSDATEKRIFENVCLEYDVAIV